MESLPVEVLLEVMFESSNPSLHCVSRYFYRLCTDTEYSRRLVLKTFGKNEKPEYLSWSQYHRFLEWSQGRASVRCIRTFALHLMRVQPGLHADLGKLLPTSTNRTTLGEIEETARDGDVLRIEVGTYSFLGAVRVGKMWHVSPSEYRVPRKLMFKFPIGYWDKAIDNRERALLHLTSQMPEMIRNVELDQKGPIDVVYRTFFWRNRIRYRVWIKVPVSLDERASIKRLLRNPEHYLCKMRFCTRPFLLIESVHNGRAAVRRRNADAGEEETTIYGEVCHVLSNAG